MPSAPNRKEALERAANLAQDAEDRIETTRWDEVIAIASVAQAWALIAEAARVTQ